MYFHQKSKFNRHPSLFIEQMIPSKPNILFLMTDQLRADYLGWAHDSRMSTPHLDRLAENGCVFENARTVNPVCQPARCALLTGRYSRQILTLAMGKNDLPPCVPTYPKALREAGYHTIGIGKFHHLHGTHSGRGDLEQVRAYNRELGFDETWKASGKELTQLHYCDWAAQLEEAGLREAYLEHMQEGRNDAYIKQEKPLDQQWIAKPWPFDEKLYVDTAIGDRIVAALDRHTGDRPFFLFGSFCGPHPPYDPPKSVLGKFEIEEDEEIWVDRELTESERACILELRRCYRAMISVIDDQVGRILDTLEAKGLADSTLVVFTSDHGEFLGDHELYNKFRPEAASVHVPLAFRLPGGGSTIRHEGLVELTDITATLLDAAGLDPRAALCEQKSAPFHDRIPGRSLLPIILGDSSDSVRDDVFSEYGGVWSSIETGEWKYVRYQEGPAAGREVLYDLKNDPREMTNLAGNPEQAETLNAMRNRLLARLDWAAAGQFISEDFRQPNA